MLRVHLVDHALRIGKVLLLPPELAVARVPARRRELGAEIDERVARQLLLAKRLRDRQDLVRPRQRPVRLHVAERPLRRHLRQAGDARVLAHDRPADRATTTTNTSSGRAGGGGRELAVGAGEVERAVRVMDEHPPPVGADQPLDRRTRAVGLELVARPDRCACGRSGPCGRTAGRPGRGRGAGPSAAGTSCPAPARRTSAAARARRRSSRREASAAAR